MSGGKGKVLVMPVAAQSCVCSKPRKTLGSLCKRRRIALHSNILLYTSYIYIYLYIYKHRFSSASHLRRLQKGRRGHAPEGICGREARERLSSRKGGRRGVAHLQKPWHFCTSGRRMKKAACHERDKNIASCTVPTLENRLKTVALGILS